MIVKLFRSRLRKEHEDEYLQWSERTEALVREIPGFVSIKTFRAEDGERLFMVELESEEAHEAWRKHLVHLKTQRFRCEKFYSKFKIRVLNNPMSHGYNSK